MCTSTEIALLNPRASSATAAATFGPTPGYRRSWRSASLAIRLRYHSNHHTETADVCTRLWGQKVKVVQRG
eukprot:6078584-Amphidinium_carterae.1